MSSQNDSSNLSALKGLGVPVTSFEIVTNAISLADLIYQAGKFAFEEKVEIIEPKGGNNIQLNVGEAGNLFLKIRFQKPRIDLKTVFYAVKRVSTKRKSGVRIELAGKQIYPPDKDQSGKALDPNNYLVETKNGIYKTEPTRIPVIAAGGRDSADSSDSYILKILAFNKRIFYGRHNHEYEEESDAAIVNLWFRNPFAIQSFMIDPKEDENSPQKKNVDKVALKLRLGYDRGNSIDLSTTGVKTCHCLFRISCSPPLYNPRVEVFPLYSADVDVPSKKGSSITVNAKNLVLDNSRYFVFTVVYSNNGVAKKPIGRIKELTIQEARVNGTTHAQGKRGNLPYDVRREWTIPIQIPPDVSTSLKNVEI